jgi:hypothetical protein
LQANSFKHMEIAPITETGENLDILIVTDLSLDWQTFATWYSLFKNLPDAQIAMVCHRNWYVPFQCFQWAKRLNVKHLYRNREDDEVSTLLYSLLKSRSEGHILRRRTLIVKAYVMATDVLSSRLLELLNEEKGLLSGGSVWYVNNLSDQEIEDAISDHALVGEFEHRNVELCCDVRSSTKTDCFTDYSKGCGKWIDTMKGCPLSSASGMVSDDMTVNELSVIDLWRKMVSLFGAVH